MRIIDTCAIINMCMIVCMSVTIIVGVIVGVRFGICEWIYIWIRGFLFCIHLFDPYRFTIIVINTTSFIIITTTINTIAHIAMYRLALPILTFALTFTLNMLAYSWQIIITISSMSFIISHLKIIFVLFQWLFKLCGFV